MRDLVARALWVGFDLTIVVTVAAMTPFVFAWFVLRERGR